MASKSVLDRQRVGKAIIAAARTHAQEVGERLQAILTPVLEDGETLPDLNQLQLLFARLLQRRLDALVAADECHLTELDDDTDIRQCRDQAAAELYDQVVAVRDLMRAAVGPERETEILGLEGRTPQDPLALNRAAERILCRLQQPGATELTASRLPSVDLDLGEIPARLEAKIGDLRDALSAVGREEREADTTQQRKNEASAAYDEVARGVADTLRGWCHLADLPNLAERIRVTRPSRRRAAA